MTTYYLEEHPPARSQYGLRSAKERGVVVVHTAESFADEVGPDAGAENVAGFIQGRTTPGSYHSLADSDSIVRLVRPTMATWGDATGSNAWAFHVSAACSAHQWPGLGADWRTATVGNMALAAAEYAFDLYHRSGLVVAPRWLTREESEAGEPGFITHARRDPARRTDPGDTFPGDAFLASYRIHAGRLGVPGLIEPEEPDMAKSTLLLVREPGTTYWDGVWMTDGIFKRKLKGEKEISSWKFMLGQDQVGEVPTDVLKGLVNADGL